METLFANFTSLKIRIALQVARKIAPCDSALKHSCIAIGQRKTMSGKRMCTLNLGAELSLTLWDSFLATTFIEHRNSITTDVEGLLYFG